MLTCLTLLEIKENKGNIDLTYALIRINVLVDCTSFLFNFVIECRQALLNFEHCVKPGGLLLIDHRNYDDIIDTGNVPAKCIYYNVSILQKLRVYKQINFRFH